MAYTDIKKDSRDQAGRVAAILKESKEAVSKLAMFSRRQNGIPDEDSEQFKPMYARLDVLLTWLNDEVEINRELKEKAKLQDMLGLLCKRPEFQFPQAYRQRALALLEKWEGENWGAPPEADVRAKVEIVGDADADDAEEDEDGRVAKKRKTSSTSTSTGRVKIPPSGHPIWGKDGIMNGLARKTASDAGRFSTVLNPELKHKKRPFDVYGHNGLEVGQWFPNRLSSLYYGAHGASQAGISGDTKNGAYSIVVSGAYDELDKDMGDVLYYSGSGSHENDDPKRHAESTNQTRTLHASLRTQNPVRVLRNKSKHRYAPTEGIRYDGLYIVVSMHRPTNAKGGLYEQFRLERLPLDKNNDIPMEYCVRRPTGQEIRDYGRINDGY
ncbi:unnamed protein product [Zymoseptoria tritici ST99CH_1E4]|uniref:YDG domain-containing protein n=1 Tax=Zymoseptoria tritici ST99CH_1E4 TaxID=1276532 RepID=A0A2H1GTW5_ZYMTR|nr:unnamed protein product [Zymoseptoria tritici ST99CH_1E4]